MNKQEARDALVTRLKADLEVVSESQRQTQEGLTHEDNKQEGDKDMRSTEASYLARGLAERVEQLHEEIGALSTLDIKGGRERAGAGALVTVEDEDEKQQAYLLTPHSGGARAEVKGMTVTLVTTMSPMGRALLGKEEGDDVEFVTPRGTRYVTIIEIA